MGTWGYLRVSHSFARGFPTSRHLTKNAKMISKRPWLWHISKANETSLGYLVANHFKNPTATALQYLSTQKDFEDLETYNFRPDRGNHHISRQHPDSRVHDSGRRVTHLLVGWLHSTLSMQEKDKSWNKLGVPWRFEGLLHKTPNMLIPSIFPPQTRQRSGVRDSFFCSGVR